MIIENSQYHLRMYTLSCSPAECKKRNHFTGILDNYNIPSCAILSYTFIHVDARSRAYCFTAFVITFDLRMIILYYIVI